MRTNITITASTNLSDEEVEKAVKEAERFAEEDKKRKEGIEVKNNADQIVYQTEKYKSIKNNKNRQYITRQKTPCQYDRVSFLNMYMDIDGL